jgi:hypothetical protein
MAHSKSLCAKVCEKVCAELTAHLQHAAGIEDGLSGLVFFIQRFVSAANLNIHFHVIALDGVYEKKSTGRLKFYSAQAPSNETIQKLVGNLATKTNNLLIRKKYLEKVEDMVLVGNTEEISNESSQHSGSRTNEAHCALNPSEKATSAIPLNSTFALVGVLIFFECGMKRSPLCESGQS